MESLSHWYLISDISAGISAFLYGIMYISHSHSIDEGQWHIKANAENVISYQNSLIDK